MLAEEAYRPEASTSPFSALLAVVRCGVASGAGGESVGTLPGDHVYRRQHFLERVGVLVEIGRGRIKPSDVRRLLESGDRSGTVLLGTTSGPNAWAAGLASPSWPGSARYLPPMLEAIENARAVYEKIRSTKNQTAP